ncbi:MAG: hypothetical protein IPP71_15190 [Bacteroidetes bacterium]|nr:hypothetical protein [Bacteroidota bacterium]
MGYQQARTGLGHGGICHGFKNSPIQSNSYREYIQTELIDSLIQGIEYSVSFYVSAGDSCGKYSSNIGTYFSNTEIDTVIYPNANLNFQPQFENPLTNVLNDNIGWTHLSGTFIANGGEKYLILGNFRDSISSTILNTGWGSIPSLVKSAYLYIDDILVAPTDSLTSINEFHSNDELTLFTLSESEYEIFSTNNPINSYEVVNCLGQNIDKKNKIECIFYTN